MPVIKCVNGHENPEGRQFCQECGARLAAPAPVHDDPAVARVREMQATLEAAQDENLKLKQQIDALRVDLGGVKDLHSRVQSAESQAAALQPQLAELHEKWRSAEAKAAEIATQLAAKLNEFEAVTSSPAGGQPRPSRMKTIIGTALALVGTFGGYGAGHYMAPTAGDHPPPNPAVSGSVVSPADFAKQQHEFKKQTEEFTKQTEEWRKKQQAEAKELTKRSQDLDARAQATERIVKDRLATSDKAVAPIGRGAVAVPVGSLAPGTLVWRGQVWQGGDTDRNAASIVVIKSNGTFTSNLTGAQISGSLTGSPCTLQSSQVGADRFNVTGKPAADNGWNQARFTVRADKKGDGWVTVFLVCVPSS